MTAETSSGQVVGAQKDKEAGKMNLVVGKTTQNKHSKTLQSKYPPSRGAKNPKNASGSGVRESEEEGEEKLRGLLALM